MSVKCVSVLVVRFICFLSGGLCFLYRYARYNLLINESTIIMSAMDFIEVQLGIEVTGSVMKASIAS